MDPDRLLSFDGHANEQLLHDSDVVSLTPKTFAVLRRLVEDAGQLVKKDDLLRSVWRDTPTGGPEVRERPRSGVTSPSGSNSANCRAVDDDEDALDGAREAVVLTDGEGFALRAYQPSARRVY